MQNTEKAHKASKLAASQQKKLRRGNVAKRRMRSKGKRPFLLPCKVYMFSLIYNFETESFLAVPFMSATTMKAMRITIKSVIEIVETLLRDEEYAGLFKYVLTGKLNQDCLEVLFMNFLLLKSTN